jgi:hypothetical protein
MIRSLLPSLILVTSFLVIQNSLFAQVIFEKGYLYQNDGKRLDCLIKNLHWKNNPSRVDYKLSEEGEVRTIVIDSVQEFQINNGVKFIRANVDIDRSLETLSELTADKQPNFRKELLLLKLIIQGDASLFQYTDGSLTRFFYSMGVLPAQQLVYKSYRQSDLQVRKNETYKQQLWNDLKCETITRDDSKNLIYGLNELRRLFAKFNACKNSKYTDYTKFEKKDFLHLALRPGVHLSSLAISNTVSPSRDAEFEKQFGIRFGIEAEIELPFNKKEWTLIIEPTYRSFHASISRDIQPVKVAYQSLELPLGVRYSYYLNPKDRLFLNASYVMDFAFKSMVEYEDTGDVKISSVPNPAVGVGYSFNTKFSFEFRYNLDRNVLNKLGNWRSSYESMSFVFGYRVF